MINIKDFKLDIFVLAGQSNAEGNGVCLTTDNSVLNDCFQIVDSYPAYEQLTDKGEFDKLICTLPTSCDVTFLQYRFCGTQLVSDFSLRFAELYKQSKFFDPSRKILIIKAAVGGSGFMKGEWGIGCPLYLRMCAMVRIALSFNNENRLMGFLWHQGESDSFEKQEMTNQERFDYYYNVFMKQMNDFESRFNVPNLPVILGDMCDEWANKKENIERTTVIENCFRKIASDLKNADVVSTDGLTSNNQEIHNGDEIHFSHKSIVELGNRYFDCFSKIIK